MKNQSFLRLAVYVEIWLTGLLLFYFVSPSFFPYTLAKLFDVFSYLIVALLILLHWKKFIYVATTDITILILLGMIAISGLWSVLPDITSITSKAMLRTILFGMYLATRYSIREQMRLFGWVFGTVAILSLILPLAIPGFGTYSNGAWRGIFPYKNYLAIYMILAAMLSLLAALNSRRQHWIAWIKFAIATTLVFLSQGKGGYVIFVASLCLLPLHKFVKQNYKLRSVLLTGALIISCIVAFLILINEKTILVNILGKDTTFNGRVPIWTLCIEQALKRPWLGYGISGFWGSNESIVILRTTWAKNSLSIDNFQLFNSHNSYIEVLLQLGFLGLFVYTVNFLSTLSRIIFLWMSNPVTENFWMLQTIIIMFLFNFTDNGGIISRGTIWIAYISISLSSAISVKRIRRNRQLKVNYSQEIFSSI
ncbi:O-antigen ligase family protein [Chlorogloeopsis sp. ULAP01]|uniref:O-antigen ligase family protein n=1 Tax=Chlorogloeopsis sp. ULAP01 TaxID=3056483 RepID=UPI0025AA50EA|nr:O-antigen ligase family protein [Chlorogloeopsis sp. ULAP01]MDM9381784.1 O-antigen ligase family protein [Chlorogloeopsis sp. ULAP01]